MFSDLESQKIPGTVYYIQKAADWPPLLFLYLKSTANYPMIGASIGIDKNAVEVP
jgi:hypothetical protein